MLPLEVPQGGTILPRDLRHQQRLIQAWTFLSQALPGAETQIVLFTRVHHFAASTSTVRNLLCGRS